MVRKKMCMQSFIMHIMKEDIETIIRGGERGGVKNAHLPYMHAERDIL